MIEGHEGRPHGHTVRAPAIPPCPEQVTRRAGAHRSVDAGRALSLLAGEAVLMMAGRPPVLRTVGAQSSRQGCRKRSRRAPRPTWLILLALLALFKHSQKGRGISWVLERMAAQAPCRP